MLEKVADTFRRKLGRPYTEDDALAWWNWVWPDFESYWKAKRYRNLSRAILGWAARVREYELDRAIETAAIAANIQLENKQEQINSEAEEASAGVTPIDYFKRLGGERIATGGSQGNNEG